MVSLGLKEILANQVLLVLKEKLVRKDQKAQEV